MDEIKLEPCQTLREYLNTGLTPEQCENAKVIIESAFSDDTSKAERIRELLKADRDGRLVVLPCKVGDVVYGFHGERPYCRWWQNGSKRTLTDGALQPNTLQWPRSFTGFPILARPYFSLARRRRKHWRS